MQGHFKCINGVTVYCPPVFKEFIDWTGKSKIDAFEFRRK